MTEHHIEKPVVFISHATSDADFANAVKQEIDKVFANGLNVFCTSSPGAIPIGHEWLDDIEKKLGTSKTIIPIITPISIERPWLWFEVGATWFNSKKGDCKIFPLCVKEIKLADLPSPLNRLQALSLGKSSDLKLLFESLISQFGFGNISSFKALNITKQIPKYKDVKILEIDKNDAVLYSGKYTGYSDDELIEVLKDKIFEPEEKKKNDLSNLFNFKEDNLIHYGKLIQFKDIDRLLDLPPGTSKRLLNIAAADYNLVPKMEKENIVRYKIKEKIAKRRTTAAA